MRLWRRDWAGGGLHCGAIAPLVSAMGFVINWRLALAESMLNCHKTVALHQIG